MQLNRPLPYTTFLQPTIGKSNVWAIEPKMELSTKSDEEKTQSALVAGGGLLVFAVLAGVALSNLPDPNQF